MPSLVGVVLGAAAMTRFEGRLAARGLLRWYALALAGVAALGHVYALSRYTWRPPVGPVPPLLLIVAGGALLVALAVTARPVGTAAYTPALDAEPVEATAR